MLGSSTCSLPCPFRLMLITKRMLQLGTHTIVSFLTFEKLRQLFGIDPM